MTVKFKNIQKQYLKNSLIEDFKKHDEDCGSTELQIASLTFDINMLSKHMKENPKDFSSLRGLKMMSAKRRNLMKYLSNNDVNAYKKISHKLGIK